MAVLSNSIDIYTTNVPYEIDTIFVEDLITNTFTQRWHIFIYAYIAFIYFTVQKHKSALVVPGLYLFMSKVNREYFPRSRLR